jgi:hypothetical protein
MQVQSLRRTSKTQYNAQLPCHYKHWMLTNPRSVSGRLCGRRCHLRLRGCGARSASALHLHVSELHESSIRMCSCPPDPADVTSGRCKRCKLASAVLVSSQFDFPGRAGPVRTRDRRSVHTLLLFCYAPKRRTRNGAFNRTRTVDRRTESRTPPDRRAHGHLNTATRYPPPRTVRAARRVLCIVSGRAWQHL